MALQFIAELCQNHLGDIDRAREMADQAVKAGATHIKIQHIFTKNLTFRPQFEEGLVRDEKTLSLQRPFRAEYDRLKQLELTSEQNRKFVEHVQSLGATPMTTCFARCDIPEIREQGFNVIKVASYDCASYQMLRELSDNFQELYISTGATYFDEIKQAAILLKQKGARYHFLHCVTIYPTPLEEMHLGRMEMLKEFSPVRVGFSDHSLVSRDGVLAAKAAIALGAEIIERHFTVLDADQSKDGPVSVRPEHIKELCDFANLSREEQFSLLDTLMPSWKDVLVGDSNRELTLPELLNRDYYRGRFASPRKEGEHNAAKMIFNWEETEIL